MRAKAWNSTSTTLTRITAEKWSLHPTVPGVERAGVCVCVCETLAFSASCLCAHVWHDYFLPSVLAVVSAMVTCTESLLGPSKRARKSASPDTPPVSPPARWRTASQRLVCVFTWCILIDLVRRLTSVMLCSGSVVCSNSAPCVTACSHRAWGQSVWPVIQLCPVLNTQRAPHRWIVSAFILCFIFFLHCA